MKKFHIVALIMVIFCGILFAGCNKNEDDANIFISDNIGLVSSIEVSAEEESKEFYITTENVKVSSDVIFDFSLADKIANIPNVTQIDNTTYKFSVVPIKAGRTQLTITVRGSSAKQTIPLTVFQYATNIELTNKLYAVKGSELIIDPTLFTFTPSSTTHKDLDIYLMDGDITLTDNNIIEKLPDNTLNYSFNRIEKRLIIGENCNQTSLKFFAKYDEYVNEIFYVTIQDKVSVENLEITTYSQLENDKNTFNTVADVYGKDAEENDIINVFNKEDINNNQTITLVSNKSHLYQKMVKIQGVSEDCYIEVESNGLLLNGNDCINNKDKNQNFLEFVLANKTASGNETVKVKITNKENPANVKEIVINVIVECWPYQIGINNQTKEIDVDLYTQSESYKFFNFELYPLSIDKTNYLYRFSIRKQADNSIVNKIPTSIEVYYGENNLAVDVNNEQFEYINGYYYVYNQLYSGIKLKALNADETKYYILIECVNKNILEENATEAVYCTNKININNVYLGASNIAFKKDFESGVIDIAKSNTAISFDGIDIKLDAGQVIDDITLGKFSIIETTSNYTICDIEQVFNDGTQKYTTELKITGKNSGTAKYIITTENGKSLTLTINVYELVNADDFKVLIKDASENSLLDSKIENDSLKSLTFRGINKTVSLTNSFEKDGKDANAYNVSYQLTNNPENHNYFTVDEAGTLKSVNATPKEINTQLWINLSVYTIENFKLKQPTDVTKIIQIDLKCFNYITDMAMYVSAENQENQKLKNNKIYNKNDLSYKNAELSYGYLYLDLNTAIKGETVDCVVEKITIIAGDLATIINGTNVYTETNIDGVGKFESLLVQDENLTSGYIGKFICEFDSDFGGLKQITMYILINDNTTGEQFESYITLSVEKYIDVDAIYTSTPLTEIYLANVETHKYYTFFTKIVPENAMFKEIDYLVEADNNSCIDVQIKGSQVTVSYVSPGSGTLRIFPISKMKNGPFYDENNQLYQNIAIKFVCADGSSEKTALKVSSLEDLKSIEMKKHYYVDSIIDCGGETLAFGTFEGTLRGTFLPETDAEFKTTNQIGEIKNFKVGYVKDKLNLGLFESVASDAKIYNLSLYGCFNSIMNIPQKSTPYYMGILCGENKGTIKNVIVNAINNDTKITVAKEKTEDSPISTSIYMGLVCGLNSNKLLITKDSKVGTLFVNCINKSGQDEQINVNFVDLIEIGKTNLTSNFAGIAGKNTGTISQTFNNEFSFSIGKFGIHANVLLKSNCSNLAGVTIDNSGEISNLTAIGEIENTNGKVYGFAYCSSETYNIISNKSRIFVRGTSDVYAFVGLNISPDASNNRNISKNVVQATDDKTRNGKNASFVILNEEASLKDYEKPMGASEYAPIYTGVSITSYYSRNVVSTTTIIENNDYSKYYGDVIRIVIEPTTKEENITYVCDFSKTGVESLKGAITNAVLPLYQESINKEEQYLLEEINKYNTLDLLTLFNVINASGNNDFIINIDFGSASLVDNGQYFSILGKGKLNLTIYSALNANIYNTFDFYVTNQFDEIELYTDKVLKNKIQEVRGVKTVELINEITQEIYIAGSSKEEVDNYNIKLVKNKEIYFDIVNNSKTYINTQIVNSALYVKAIQSGDFTNVSLTATPYIVYNEKTYYLDKEKYNDDLKILLVDSLTYEKFNNSIYFTHSSAIQNLNINKSVITIEPSDIINFKVSYEQYENCKDELSLIIKINGDSSYTLINNEIQNSEGNVIYYVTQDITEIKKDIITQYTVNYSLKLNGSLSEIFEIINKAEVEFIFTSKSCEKTLTIQYIPENITSVLITNFSAGENEELITYEDSNVTLNASGMKVSGNVASTGDLNAVNAYVYTKYSDFEYVEVKIHIDGGYIAHMLDGKINKNVNYINIGDYSHMRIYKKNNIKLDASSGLLLISLIYSVPKYLTDNTNIIISFDFYNNENQVCFHEQIDLISRIENQVSFEIVGKEETVINGENVYTVARGVSYLLDVTSIGYTDEQIIFESSNENIAKIRKVGGNYYLDITSDVLIYEEDFVNVSITSYGKKEVQSKMVESRKIVTQLNVAEFVASTPLFESEFVSLKLYETVNLKAVIANLASLERGDFVSPTKLKDFKNSLVENISLRVVYSTLSVNNEYIEEYIILNDGEKLKNNLFEIDGYEITPLTLLSGNNYYRVEAYYDIYYNKGIPAFEKLTNIDGIDPNDIFDVNVYMGSTENIPMPIYDYNDMLQMQTGEYYRLVNNIEIPLNDYQIIESAPKMLDGNGYSLIIRGGNLEFNGSEISNFSIFNSINEESIIKNLTIELKSNLSINFVGNQSVQGYNISLLALTNYGIIANCKINTKGNLLNVKINDVPSVVEQSHFAGLCVNNKGYISNCKAEYSAIINGATVGGLVYNNEESIVSCSINNLYIYNSTDISSLVLSTAGFVNINSGNIRMCYVQGSNNGNRIFADYSTNEYYLLNSNPSVSGFVAENSGNISDCYSNIPILSSNIATGFVLNTTGGLIERCISLCKLDTNNTAKYGFVKDYSKDGLFVDCVFVIQNSLINYSTSDTNYNYSKDKGYSSKISGVNPYGIKDFNDPLKFSNYVINESNKEQGVWFFANDESKEQEGQYKNNAYETYLADQDMISESKKFKARVPQLVSANWEINSKYKLVYNEEDTSDYYYINDSNYALGSKQNPYLITSAMELEENCKQKTINQYNYCILICDIDYQSEEIYASELYSSNFVGYFEGNGYTISNYSVNSMTSIVSGGLFAQIGSAGSINKTCFKNVNLEAYLINLPNVAFVGGLCGTLVNSNLYNVHIDGDDVVSGKNIVGGIVGRTIKQNTIINITSNLSARASTIDNSIIESKDINKIDGIMLDEVKYNYAKLSYAGSVIGYVGGNTFVKNISIGENSNVLAMVAGLAFGGVGSNSEVANTNIIVNSKNNVVKAHVLGGILSGDLRGKLTNINIESSLLGDTIFSCAPITPLAIGSLSGYANSAIVNGFTSESGLSIIGCEVFDATGEILEPSKNSIVKYTGGLFGIYKNETDGQTEVISNVNVTLSISGGQYVGGVAGYLIGNEENLISEQVVVDNTKTPPQSEIKHFLGNSNPTTNKITLLNSRTYTDSEMGEKTINLYYSYTYDLNDNVYVGSCFGNESQDISNIIINNALLIRYGKYNVSAGDVSLIVCGLQFIKIDLGTTTYPLYDNLDNVRFIYEIIELSKGSIAEIENNNRENCATNRK